MRQMLPSHSADKEAYKLDLFTFVLLPVAGHGWQSQEIKRYASMFSCFHSSAVFLCPWAFYLATVAG